MHLKVSYRCAEAIFTEASVMLAGTILMPQWLAGLVDLLSVLVDRLC